MYRDNKQSIMNNFQKQQFIKVMKEKQEEAAKLKAYWKTDSWKGLLDAIKEKHKEACNIDLDIPF